MMKNFLMMVSVVMMVITSTTSENETKLTDFDEDDGNVTKLGLLQLALGDGDGSNQLFQDPFCMSDQTNKMLHESSKDGKPDKRYDVHSFAILHGRLYIITATSIFNVSLAEEPPFKVSSRTLFTDFNTQLSNMLYSTPLIASQVFTSVGIEIDEEEEVLVLGVSLTEIDFINENNHYDANSLTFGERMRDIFILHNRRRAFQPHPITFDYDFSARLADTPYLDKATNESWNANRFIVGDEFFYFVEVDWEDRFNITHYVVHPGVNFTITPMFVFEMSPKTKKVWMFSPTNNSIEGFRPLTNASELVFAKNGFIQGSKMYLVDWGDAQKTDYLEYTLVDEGKEPSAGGRVKITMTGSNPTWTLVNCRLANPDKIYVHVAEPLLLIIVFVLSLQVALGKRSTVGRRVINGPVLTYYEVNEELIFSKYGTVKG